MLSKNDEAPTALTVEASNLPVNLQEKTNMNSVQNNELTFHNTSFAYMEMAGQIWLTAAEVGQALEYADDKAVQRIYSRHADEFTEKMTGVVKVTTPRGMQESRVFSLRGAHLIAMFARTPKAKEFRRWVLDILDREVAQGNVNPAFDFEMHARNAQTSLSHITYIHQEWCSKLRPALRALGSPLAIDLEDRIKAVGAIAFGMERALSKHNKKGMIH